MSASKNPKSKAEMDNEIWLPNFNELLDSRWDKLLEPGFSNYYPRMNIHESENNYHIDAELPGIKKEEIQIKLKDDYLVISGEKKSMTEESKKNYRRIERANGTFYRSVSIPRDIDRDKITAELSDGILQIDIPRTKNAPASIEKKILIK